MKRTRQYSDKFDNKRSKSNFTIQHTTQSVGKYNEEARKQIFLNARRSTLPADSELLKSYELCIQNSEYVNPLSKDDILLPKNVHIDLQHRKGRKIKYAFYISYRGTGYQGLQYNPSARTIECEIINAMYKSGLIDASQREDIHKTKFTRAARTDKGVHAACNTIGLKIRVLPELMYPEVKAAKVKYQPVLQEKYMQVLTRVQDMLKSIDINVPTTVLQEDIVMTTYGELTMDENVLQYLTPMNANIAQELQAMMTVEGMSDREKALLSLGYTKVVKNEEYNIAFPYDVCRGMDEENVLFVINKYKEESAKKYQEYKEKLAIEHSQKGYVKKFNNTVFADTPAETEQNDTNTANASTTSEQPVQTDDSAATNTNATRKPNNNNNNEDDDDAEESAFTIDELNLMYNTEFSNAHICQIINSYLPAQIRVVRAIRVFNSFDSKTNASSRTYEYIIPSFAFLPITEYPKHALDEMYAKVPPLNTMNEDRQKLHVALIDKNEKDQTLLLDEEIPISPSIDDILAANPTKLEEDTNANAKGKGRGGRNGRRGGRNNNNNDDDDDDIIEDDVSTSTTTNTSTNANDGIRAVLDQRTSKALEAMKSGDMRAVAEAKEIAYIPDEILKYRMTEELRMKIDAFLEETYGGTRNYHNFTKGREFKDPSCKRYINSFKTAGFFYKDGVEFVHLIVHGQSFMLHQIRKMVGYAVATIRGSITTPDINSLVFSSKRIRVPMAPALGLLLDRVHFDTYDMKAAQSCSNNNEAVLKAGRDTMNEEYKKCLDLLTSFKEREIYPEICTKELTTLSCWEWLHWTNDSEFWGHEQTDIQYNMSKKCKITAMPDMMDTKEHLNIEYKKTSTSSNGTEDSTETVVEEKQTEEASKDTAQQQ